MVRFGRAFIAIVLVFSILLPSCAPEDDSETTYADPFDDLVEELELTEDQAEQLRSGTGIFQLTTAQVELIRPTIEQVLEEPGHGEWLGEARWSEMQDIYDGVLADGRVELQRVADLANDIYESIQEEEPVEVVTVFKELSEEEAHVMGGLRASSHIPGGSTLLYTPRGIEEGDKEFSPNPTMWGSTFAWANHVSVANAESGGIGVHTDAALGMGSAQASARQRIIIHVPHDDTDVEIEAVILYVTAITHVFSDVAGTHISYSDMSSGKLASDVIDPLFGWRAAIEKVAGTLESVIGIVLVGKSLSEVMDAVRLYGDFYDYDEMRRALLKAGAERRHVTHSASSLPAGFYAFEIGLGAQAVSVLLGAATAVGIGQVTQIEVTQSFEEEETEQKVYLSELRPYHVEGLRGILYDLKADIVMGGKEYDYGIKLRMHPWGHWHTPKIFFNLDGAYSRLSGMVGLDDNLFSARENDIQFYGDDSLLLEVNLKPGDLPKPVDMNVTGIAVLRIEVHYPYEVYEPYVNLADMKLEG